MALVLADRVQETSTTSGTGTLSLAGAVTGYRTFVTGVGTTNTTYYTIFDSVANVWECGLGTVTSGSPDTLSRTTVYSNSSGTTSPLTLAGNAVNVWCDYPGSRAVSLDANGNVTITGLRETKTAPTISSGTLTVNCSVGNVFAVSLNANITTLTFTNVPASGTAYALALVFTADGTARTITWGSAVKWSNGTAPTMTSTNGKMDTIVMMTYDGGTTWLAFVSGQNA